MSIPCFIVDAFAEAPFAGNSAAVCLLDQPANEAWLKLVAREFNLAETAFVVRQGQNFSLRWFTPTVEVALCGHATLAAAHVLWQEEIAAPDETIRFQTLSGVLTAAQRGAQIELDFPLEPETEVEPPEGLAESLGIVPRYVGRNRFDYLVEVESEAAVRELRPDFWQLAQIPSRGFIITSRSADERFDFVSRFFAPAAGIDEDPVTGSAHCCLGPFWRKRLGKNDFVGFQASQRGGVVRVRVTDNRALLAGQAITTVAGRLLK